jgi:DNA-binding CsgD family transcriptional regulator
MVDDGNATGRPGLLASLRTAGYSLVGASSGLQPDSDASASAVLVFDVDALGIDREAAPGLCDVRLVGFARGSVSGASRADPSAVLVLRALTRSRLVACIRALKEGSGSMPPELLCQMLAGSRDAAPDAHLTQRELDVLRLLADGGTTRDIAERMSYSERTVKNIVRDLLVKLNGRTRAHAVALATRRGMI